MELAFFLYRLEGHASISLLIPNTSTKNQAEYEVVLKGIKLLREIGANVFEIVGDSMLVVTHLIGRYDCNTDILRVYHEECLELLKEFKVVSIQHVPKVQNEEAKKLAQHTSSYRAICAVTAWNYQPMIGETRLLIT